MLIDKNTVLEMLDIDGNQYEAYCIAINLLPSSAMFELVYEETITAEYYDEVTQELLSFPLKYVHTTKVDLENNLDYEYYKEEEDSIKSSSNEYKYPYYTIMIGVLVLVGLLCLGIFIFYKGGYLWE